MSARIEELKCQIEAAFAGVAYPGDNNIGYDPNDWEANEINEHFRGKHWKELPRATLQYHQHDLGFFSPEGLRYYLPAYMFAALERFGDTLDFTVYNVEPDEGDLAENWAEQYEGFTLAQKRAVRAWLECLREELALSVDLDHVNAALEKYWGRDWR